MVAKRVVGITGKKNTGVVASGQVFPDALSVEHLLQERVTQYF